MAVSKEQVLAPLAKVPSPGGAPLTGRARAVRRRRHRRQGVLLDHRRCRRGEGLGTGAQGGRRGGARHARRAIRAGRADRRTRRRRRRGPQPAHVATQPRAAGSPACARPSRRQGAARHARRRGDHRGRLRQRRRRQIHHRGQSRARPARSRAESRHPRRRYLWALAAQAARHQGEAADHRRHPAQADRRATVSR